VKVIGITGGTGSGKTSALRVLRDRGATIIDCDVLYHELLASSRSLNADIGERFDGVYYDGVLDRKALGKVVFSDREALRDLNEITHRYVTKDVRRKLKAAGALGGKIAAVDAIALFESGLNTLCNTVVGITAPRELRIKRIIQRDGVPEEYAALRIDAQKPDSFFFEHCDHILENHYRSPTEFEIECSKFFDKLLGGRL
jgi:dephospho-CoA kinase